MITKNLSNKEKIQINLLAEQLIQNFSDMRVFLHLAKISYKKDEVVYQIADFLQTIVKKDSKPSKNLLKEMVSALSTFKSVEYQFMINALITNLAWKSYQYKSKKFNVSI